MLKIQNSELKSIIPSTIAVSSGLVVDDKPINMNLEYAFLNIGLNQKRISSVKGMVRPAFFEKGLAILRIPFHNF